jgi:23S rRNA (adenine2503-C2)-methyltransferase
LNNPHIFDLTLRQLQGILKYLDQPSFRAKQIYEWLYEKFASSFDEMSDLPKSLRNKLSKEIVFSHLSPALDLKSSDGWTRKILFDLPDKSQLETVLMEYEKRKTTCISTQAGCGLGCTFCATGQGGLQRNITAGEIVEQVIYFDRFLHRSPPSLREGGRGGGLSNIVYMGMGEPFANYKEVMRSIRNLTDPNGYNFGARRITISTVGLVPQILMFIAEKIQVNLAVSLHAATDELRDTMIPINRKYPLRELISACREYTKKTRRRLSFEWALIDEVNDSEEQAKLLAKLIKGMLCHVNLIALNPTTGFLGRESTRSRIKKFREILTSHGIPNTLRLRRGIDINAGCGQLRQATQKTGSITR